MDYIKLDGDFRITLPIAVREKLKSDGDLNTIKYQYDEKRNILYLRKGDYKEGITGKVTEKGQTTLLKKVREGILKVKKGDTIVIVEVVAKSKASDENPTTFFVIVALHNMDEIVKKELAEKLKEFQIYK